MTIEHETTDDYNVIAVSYPAALLRLGEHSHGRKPFYQLILIQT